MKVVYKTLTLVAMSLLLIGKLSAQDNWTLRECIEYAREHSIQVKKSQLSAESYSVDVSQSKAALFPTLSGSISQRFTNSQVDDGVGGYKYEGAFNGQYSLTTNWTLYNGGQNINNIKQAKLNKESEEFNTQNIQNDIEISITQTYLQLLYTREAIKNNENIVAASELQLQQTKDFLDAGSITRSEYAQVEAQYSSDKYNLVLAQNSFDSYKLQLKQLLELDTDIDFTIYFPEVDDQQVLQSIPLKNEVYQSALNIMPQIQASRLNTQSAALSRASAKAGYLPSLSASGSIGTGNIYDQSLSFSTQISRNFNQSIGLTLSIPIFNGMQNKSNVKRADLAIKVADLELLDSQKALLRSIETLYQDAVSGQSKYRAAKDKLNASELSYQLVSEQYNLGMRNTVELTTEKTNYINALQELLQAKYTAILSLKLLNFYQGQEITL